MDSNMDYGFIYLHERIVWPLQLDTFFMTSSQRTHRNDRWYSGWVGLPVEAVWVQSAMQAARLPLESLSPFLKSLGSYSNWPPHEFRHLFLPRYLFWINHFSRKKTQIGKVVHGIGWVAFLKIHKVGPLRSKIVRKMELWGPYKWPYQWVNGGITPLNTSITLLITGGAHLVPVSVISISPAYATIGMWKVILHPNSVPNLTFERRAKRCDALAIVGITLDQAEYDLLFGIKIQIKVHSLSTILCVCCVNVDILSMFWIIFV